MDRLPVRDDRVRLSPKGRAAGLYPGKQDRVGIVTATGRVQRVGGVLITVLWEGRSIDEVLHEKFLEIVVSGALPAPDLDFRGLLRRP